jgi:hypothetical protein
MAVPICVQLDAQGNIYPLEDPDAQSGFSWCNPYRSPGGQWLAYERHSEQEDDLILYNALTRERQTIKMPNGTSLLNPVFDTANRRIAYTIVADPAKQINSHHAWAIYVRDLATGTETLFGGPFMSRPDDELQPSRPIAWIGDELLLDAFTYLGEDVNQGVWVLDVSQAAPGEAVFLQTYDRQVLSIQALSPRVYRKPTVSPDGKMLAFLIHDYDYETTCLEHMGDDPGLTVGLGIVPTTGGEPRTLVNIAGENSALLRLLTWSPDGQQILFTQSKCQDETSLSEVALHTIDLQGNITGEWLLAPIDNMWSFSTLWCTPDDVFYVRDWDELRHLNLSTGRDEQVLSGDLVQLVGCLP